MREYNVVKRHLLTTINLCAPNGVVQNKFVDVMNEMELAGESEEQVIKTIVGMLYDGLAYGNW